jgi:hypothetical protein
VAVYATASTRRLDDVARLSGVLDDGTGEPAPASVARTAYPDLAGAADAWLAGHLADPRWFRISADLILAHAHLPELPEDLIDARRRLRVEVGDWLEAMTTRSGRRLTVPAEELATQVLALGNGTVLDHLVDPKAFVAGRFGRAVERLVTASSEPHTRRPSDRRG